MKREKGSDLTDNCESSYRRFLSGDDNAFAEIIKNYKDPLMLYLNTFVGDLHVAEDLCEETFVKIVIKKPHYNGKASFKTWLYTIGGNLAKDYLRKRGRRAECPLEKLGEMPEDEADFEKSIIASEQKIILRNAMSLLKTDHRTVLWLVYFESLSIKEASFVLKKSVHATETLVYRAKNALKAELERSGFDYENI